MKNFFLIVAVVLIASSCQKLKDPGATAAVKVANEWWVTLDLDGTEDYYGIGHQKIAINLNIEQADLFEVIEKTYRKSRDSYLRIFKLDKSGCGVQRVKV